MRSISSDPLPNPRHEAFAQEVASGRNATQAYLNVYGTKNCPSGPDRRAASTGGHRLLRRKCITARIKAIQQAGAAGVALELREIHEFLTRVVRTPAGQVTPSSDLCTRVKQTRTGATDVWMPDKLACIRLSAKLQGFLDTVRPARTTTESDPPNPEEADHDPRVVTEEYRAILIAEKRAAALEEIRQAEEDPIGEEERQAEERRILEEKYFRKTPTPPVRPGPPVQSAPPTGPNQPVPTPAIAEPVPPGPPAWVGPSGRQPYFGMNFRSQKPETRNQKPGVPRVTPEIFSEKVSNSHHPIEPTSRDNQEPNLARRIPRMREKTALARPPVAQAGEANQKPETRAEALQDAQAAMGANQTWPGEAERSRQPSSTQQARDRMSREAALRTRLTGDGCTSDALLVV